MPFGLKVICDSEKYVPCMVAERVLIDCDNKLASSASCDGGSDKGEAHRHAE